MNKHTKLAILVAPILAVIGYIASDYYVEYQANQPKIFQLTQQDTCSISEKKCLLISGDFKINIYNERNKTILNATFPLDEVTLFVVDNSNNAQPYAMSVKDNPYYWQTEVLLVPEQTLRLIAAIKGSKYIAEFQAK